MNKTSGTKEKRRFTPKAQAKSDPETSASSNEPVPSTSTSQSSVRQRSIRGVKGSRGRGRGRSGRNEGRFVVPTGQAFFTGGASGTSFTSSSGSLRIVQAKLTKGNNAGDSTTTEDVKPMKTEFPSKASHSNHAADEHNLKSDSSSLRNENNSKNFLEWPPSDFKPLDPVELPFGPRSCSKRMELAQSAIFATDLTEQAALDNEENEAMFLIQLPSTIAQAPQLSLEDESHISSGATDMKPRKQLKPGKLGKIQITKSGKVFLLVNDESGDNNSNIKPGRRKRGDSNVGIIDNSRNMSSASSPIQRYEINRGITPAFMQVVASVRVQNTKNYSNELSQDDQQIQAKQEVKNELHLLGTITDKIVVTPDFDIGQRAANVVSTGLQSEWENGTESVSLVNIKKEKN